MTYLRNAIARTLANAALRLATPWYRNFIAGAIKYGMDAAADDVIHHRSPPLAWQTIPAKRPS